MHYLFVLLNVYLLLNFPKARYKKDVEMARKLWKELIDHGHKEEARVWLDYANFER